MKQYKVILLLVSLFFVLESKSQTETQNYVTTYSAKTELQGSIVGNNNIGQVSVDVQYFDGLGRPSQHVAKGSSPNAKDLISGIVGYDKYGRINKTYLPYEEQLASGEFRSDWVSKIDDFYDGTWTNSVPNESEYYYSEIIYEKSPDSRPDYSFGPGNAWRTASAKTDVDYNVNSIDDNVPYFDVDNSGYIEFVSNYSTGELIVTTVIDENNHWSKNYTNKNGQVVCIRKELGNGFISTYYLYDHYDLLTYVVPPQASEIASTNWNSHLNEPTFRKNWMFQFQYDDKNLLITKQEPGAEPIHLIYDELNRLVLIQTGNQRGNNIKEVTDNTSVEAYENVSYLINSGKSLTLSPGFKFTANSSSEFVATFNSSTFTTNWSYIKYDQLNRPVLKGIVTITGKSTQQLRNEITKNQFTVSYVGNASGNNEGYSKTNLPGQVSDEIQYVTYFDNHYFSGHTHWSLGNFTTEPLAKGFITGYKIRQLNGSLLQGVIRYDDKFRVIQTQKEHHLGGKDVIDISYKNKVFDLITGTTRTHKKNGVSDIIIKERFEYDHMGRLQNHYHQIGTDVSAEVLLANYRYNELGQLIEKNLGGGLQSLDYAYNIRGWLTHLNNGGNIDLTENDVFGFELKYENSGQYNGNIGEINWKSIDDDPNTFDGIQSYDYTYDKLNRLTSAQYYGVGGGHFNMAASYDKNGNITSLNRNYKDQEGDRLVYNYGNYERGNQVLGITDQAQGSQKNFGFVDDAAASVLDYTYDFNGNMISDLNKSITGIDYNHLNLANEITYKNSTGVEQSILYSYDASGNKLRKQDASGLVIDYVAGIQYLNGTASFIQHAEGRYKFGGTYEFDIKDHLGNVRSTIEGVPIKTFTRTFDDGQGLLWDDDGYSEFTTVQAHSGTTAWSVRDDVDFLEIPVLAGDVINAEVWSYKTTGSIPSLKVYFESTAGTIVSLGATGNSGSNNTWVKLELSNIAVNGAGVVWVMLESGNNVSTYFDDLKVTQNTGGTTVQVIQRDDYYPFGLTFNHHSISRVGGENLYLYNGAEQDAVTQYYEMRYRGYDPSIGRFMQIDPMAMAMVGINPYHFGYDNPIRFNDPLGLVPENRGADGLTNDEWMAQHRAGSWAESFQQMNDFQQWSAQQKSERQQAEENGQVVNGIPQGIWNNAATYGKIVLENNKLILQTLAISNKGAYLNTYEFEIQQSGGIGDWISGGMLATNFAVGAVSTYTVGSGKYYKWNEVWHKYKTPSAGTAWRWQKRWNNFGAKSTRAKQLQTVAGARALNGVLTKVGGGLLVADIALSGELKPSHAINAVMLGASTTGVGAIAAGAWFLADFGTMGVNYLINGEATGLGDMIDQSIGTYEMYDGLY